MAKTVVGLFDTLTEAQNVVQQLVDAGFDRNEVSMLANDARGEYSSSRAVGETSSTAEGNGWIWKAMRVVDVMTRVWRSGRGGTGGDRT